MVIRPVDDVDPPGVESGEQPAERPADEARDHTRRRRDESQQNQRSCVEAVVVDAVKAVVVGGHFEWRKTFTAAAMSGI